MSYSDYGRESNLGPWVSEIRYASTTAREFNPASLGEYYEGGPAYSRYGAPLMMGSYGGNQDDGLGLFGIKISLKNPFGPNSIFGKTLAPVVKGIPFVGPAIGVALDQFNKRVSGAALEAGKTVAQQSLQNAAASPAVQSAAAGAAGDAVSKYLPYALGAAVLLLLLKRR